MKSLERDLDRVTLVVAISLSELLRSSAYLEPLLDIWERKALRDSRLGGLASLWDFRTPPPESSDPRDFLLALGRKLKMAEKSDSNGFANVR